MGTFFYNGTVAPGAPLDILINRPVYGLLGLIGQTPLGDPGTIATLETSGIPYLQAPGAALAGLRALNIARAGAVADGIVVNANVAGRANFYVTSEGVAVPATGYRAIGGQRNITEALGGTIVPRPNGTYVTFDDVTGLSPSDARSFLQLNDTPSHVVIFDTLPHASRFRIPREYYGTGLFREPLTVSYPNFGRGGATQATTDLPITPITVQPLPKGGK